LVEKSVDEIVDETFIILNKIQKNEKLEDSKILGIYKKKKIISVSNAKYFEISKGESFTLERKKQLTEMTFELMQKIIKGEVDEKDVKFKEYNYKAFGKRVEGGYLHPLLKVRTEFREIFLELGFEEMKTNRFVESSFWNFDALFQPQQHPARDAHDTFFISKPEKTLKIPQDYLEIVKGVHENGGYGSIGYRYDWKKEETEKNLLRTHTTAISTKLLYEVSQEIKKTGVFKPRKFFSIDRVFRNEATDQTHLCEFHQIEGMVVGKGLSLGDLIGLLTTFFQRIGIKELKFKPAYNPYTEPSLEIFGIHPQLGLIEVGNSGMFRPEMLLPMGFPEDVVVIAWGLSLERPTMIKYGYKDIRLLIGDKVPLQEIAEKPLCFYE
jgi:phenylalanyl-tRNA synthetase alpha chain